MDIVHVLILLNWVGWVLRPSVQPNSETGFLLCPGLGSSYDQGADDEERVHDGELPATRQQSQLLPPGGD